VSTQYGPAPTGWTGNQPGYPTPPASPPSKPATLAVAFWLSFAVGALTVVGAVIAIMNGKDHIRAYVTDEVRDRLGADLGGDFIQQAIGDQLDDVYHTLVIKAVIAIVMGVVVLALAAAARNGGTGARIGLTVVLVVHMCAGSGIQLADPHALPTVSLILASLTPLFDLIAIVLVWLPATSRYAQARKAVR
jgi:hypothetical protein